MILNLLNNFKFLREMKFILNDPLQKLLFFRVSDSEKIISVFSKITRKIFLRNKISISSEISSEM